MGLFDELLKKPPQPTNDDSTTATPASSGQGDSTTVVQDAPVKIEKTEEQSIMTEAPTLPDAPIEPNITAEEDNSAVLVRESDIETIPSQDAPIENPTVEVRDSEEQPSNVLVANSIPEITEAPAPKAETSTENNTSLGDILNSMPETPAPSTSIFNFGEEESSTETNEEVEETSEFGNLQEYIKTNISQSETLIAKIDAAHTTKLEEAAGYKSEKERFAELEEQAYEDAEKMMIEKAHTERMKAYFVEQLSEAANEATPEKKKTEITPEAVAPSFAEDEPPYDEPPMEEDIMLIEDAGIDGSVETALTGIAVQNSVSNTVEKKHKPKKHEEKKEETFSLI